MAPMPSPVSGLGLSVTIGWRRAGEPARTYRAGLLTLSAGRRLRLCPDRVRSLIAAPRALRLGAGRHARSGGVAAGTPARR